MRVLKTLLRGLVPVFCAAQLVHAAAPFAAVELRCEYRTNPLGIDAPRPRLSWMLESASRGALQSAYQVLVSSDPARLAADRGDMWNSGKVRSRQSMQIEYSGAPLTSNAWLYWKVRVWDETGRASPWSAPAHWSMGPMGNWTAKWIGWPRQVKGSGPLPLLRKEFRVAAPVRRASVHISGLGFFELSINGRRVGDHVLDPGWTNYRKSVFYVTHDVTTYLRRGGNAIGVMLGNGMYNVAGGRYAKFTGSFGEPKAIVQLRLEYADGAAEEIGSDASWKSAAGPISFSCIYGGEDYDAKLEQPGWDRPGFDDSGWEAAALVDGPGGRLAAQNAPPIKVTQIFKPVRVTEPGKGIYVYDLGQNFSGWPALKVRGPAGRSVKVTPGELLDAGGLVSQRSSGGPVSFTYTLKGGAPEAWSPRFTYYGFRYLQVEGAVPADAAGPADEPRLLGIEGQFVHSSATRVGHFSCSSTLLNRIHGLIDASMRSNLQSILTDCPHREKLGWLEVSHLLGPSLFYNYDLATLYAKIANDTAEAQTEAGMVPTVAPAFRMGRGDMGDSPEWGSATVILPWLLYQWYGDRRALEDRYDNMKRYAAYLSSKATGHIVTYGLGDWCDVGPGTPGRSKCTPAGVTATAIHYGNLAILQRAAAALGSGQEAAEFGNLAAQVRKAFHERFFDAARLRYATGSQTANAMPYALDMVPEQFRRAVLDDIVRDIRGRGNHPTSGDVGLPYLFRALSAGGRSDVVFDLASRTDAPSYGDQLARGVTALAETWDANPTHSQNHCMLGHIDEWFYSGLAGISSGPDGSAFERPVIRPQIVGDLAWVDAGYMSPYGRIRSRWERTGRGGLRLTLKTPANTTATVFVPAASPDEVREKGRPAAQARGVRLLRQEEGAVVFEVGGGEYEFTAYRRESK